MRNQGSSLTVRTAPVFFMAIILATTGSVFGGTEKVLHPFAYGKRGAGPIGSLLLDSAGNLYGTSNTGGSHNLGTVFELLPNSRGGWTEKVLHTFNGKDGANPYAGLILDSKGNLYGTTESGGIGSGTVFELTPASNGTWVEKVIYGFRGGNDGAYPTAGLTFDEAGNLYGTTAGGGNACSEIGCGTIFELMPNTSGWAEKVLYKFSGGSDGGSPNGGVIFDVAGNLYGTTVEGGLSGDGAVFTVSPSISGWSETVLHSFTGGTDGANPHGGLIFDSVGNLYGTTALGTVFKLTPAANGWDESVLYNFVANDVLGGLVFGASGNLYGTTSEGGNISSCANCGTVFQLTPVLNGQWVETTLHTFTGRDGEHPYARLIFDQVGNLFGTTAVGGTGGIGTVFELSLKSAVWTNTVIYSFIDTDGQLPRSGLIFDTEGNLYGTTLSGGSHNGGSVFKLTPSTSGWNETILYSFCAKTLCRDGMEPIADLIFDASGNLYGTTRLGGSHNSGTVFKLTHSSVGWGETVLYSFCAKRSCQDGFHPVAGVILDAIGNLYGMTESGGGHAVGTVFKLSPSTAGWTETVLYSFCHTCGGAGTPSGLLHFDTAGNLYGTTQSGGIGSGTVFELTPGGNGSWVEKVLYAFGGGNDGVGPMAGLIFDAAGNLFGTTSAGGGTGCGGSGCGTIFELMSNTVGSWTESVLYRFGGTDGDSPQGQLILDAAGNLYGTTAYGGAGLCSFTPFTGCGTVFELSPNGAESWTEKILYSFSGRNDGKNPEAGLLLDAVGNLYGTTYTGTVYNAGVAFEISP